MGLDPGPSTMMHRSEEIRLLLHRDLDVNDAAEEPSTIATRWARCCREGPASGWQAGGITFIQRFASSLALNVHFHSLLLDGVYVTCPDGTVRFVPLPPPTNEDIVILTKKVGCRVRQALRRAGKCLDELDPEPDCCSRLESDLAVLTSRGPARRER